MHDILCNIKFLSEAVAGVSDFGLKQKVTEGIIIEESNHIINFSFNFKGVNYVYKYLSTTKFENGKINCFLFFFSFHFYRFKWITS